MHDALAMLDEALGYLASADVASLPVAVQADALRGLERAESRQSAARARTLAAFTAQGGQEADGHGSARTWLTWQTRTTRATAAAHVAWSRRLAAHRAVTGALAAGEVSLSWARQICGWSERLPEHARAEADAILLQAAAGGADLADLAGLAEEIYRRTAGPDHDGDDGFDERRVSLDLTWRGAGRLNGDLTPGCATALGAVLETLSRKAGPEDTRTTDQRRHDALEEACRRLIATQMLPGQAGQPTRIQVHLSLDQLRGQPGAPKAERAWAAARASQPGWLTGPEAEAAACDASIVPVVTGHVDHAALDKLTDEFTAQPLSPATQRRLRRALLGLAAQVLSGPGGLAACLRAGLGGPLASASLPLDVGAASEIIPAHLRRAVTTRHRHCAFPGCDAPAVICQIHHLIPRARGGPTSLANLVPLCTFHHLVAIHRWGWKLVLNPDATTTATSPDGTRTLHSHSPPASAA